ncbi:hypothetical protein HWV23_03345 [Natronomonas halophila]|uniref:hypothetical protein n=1 Tax=Natronomonas halophila TaxID=2747817 RepID=UPI0015B549DD|nr:hypothetical protein [Natronomonas halophila]QLD84786.1 hypothetical protein HWV23_03345 [Natronomonas halophila]
MSDDSVVTLGEVEFDPVDIQDFRLSVEGTSGTGKSNTLAVILEDLADVPIPTLIVERLGALTPVRLVDERITVVGARDEEGIDLAVAIEDLDKIGEWVLDRGMKILVDISTYADYEAEKSRIHLAAAKALQSLNDRAHEKYRSSGRTKSLLVLDEAHMLAPKDSAPQPELDDYVKRCRGQIIKAATEGGNKGISAIVGYQRRAFLHNGVIQLCQDFISHKPGDEDLGRTADALRCSEEQLDSLETGEILARGQSITDGDLVGPTEVRKRTSPDPREETFEIPETPDEIADVLKDIQEEVEEEAERRSEREDELERLREKNEALEEENEELRQELEDTDRLASALENLGSNGGGAVQDVGEGVADLQERVDELKAKRDALEADLEDARAEAEAAREERDELEDQLADVEAELQELRAAFDGAAEDVASLVETFDVEVDFEQPTTSPETHSSVDASTEHTAGSGGVQDDILADFVQDAVDRLVEKTASLSEQEKKLLKFIEARGKTLDSQKAWAQAALGLDGNPNSTHYNWMSDLIDAGFVRKNNNGSIAPNVRGLVKNELADYDVNEETVEETYEAVLAQLAQRNEGGER